MLRCPICLKPLESKDVAEQSRENPLPVLHLLCTRKPRDSRRVAGPDLAEKISAWHRKCMARTRWSGVDGHFARHIGCPHRFDYGTYSQMSTSPKALHGIADPSRTTTAVQRDIKHWQAQLLSTICSWRSSPYYPDIIGDGEMFFPLQLLLTSDLDQPSSRFVSVELCGSTSVGKAVFALQALGRNGYVTPLVSDRLFDTGEFLFVASSLQLGGGPSVGPLTDDDPSLSDLEAGDGMGSVGAGGERTPIAAPSEPPASAGRGAIAARTTDPGARKTAIEKLIDGVAKADPVAQETTETAGTQARSPKGAGGGHGVGTGPGSAESGAGQPAPNAGGGAKASGASPAMAVEVMQESEFIRLLQIRGDMADNGERYLPPKTRPTPGNIKAVFIKTSLVGRAILPSGGRSQPPGRRILSTLAHLGSRLWHDFLEMFGHYGREGPLGRGFHTVIFYDTAGEQTANAGDLFLNRLEESVDVVALLVNAVDLDVSRPEPNSLTVAVDRLSSVAQAGLADPSRRRSVCLIVTQADKHWDIDDDLTKLADGLELGTPDLARRLILGSLSGFRAGTAGSELRTHLAAGVDISRVFIVWSEGIPSDPAKPCRAGCTHGLGDFVSWCLKADRDAEEIRQEDIDERFRAVFGQKVPRGRRRV